MYPLLSIVEVNLYLFRTTFDVFYSFRSDHKCTLEISSGILTTTSCTENHVFQPLKGQGDHGAKTRVIRILNLIEVNDGITPGSL